MLAQKAEDFGCCWETVMTAYRQLDPQAHHSWRMWQGTVSGKAGITFGGKVLLADVLAIVTLM